ncbi:MAG: hypothetical protein COV45_02160 [Deltaproteobacteria bacterium CG11_big_fil_rev_8_21_14_0_20_47_16]|nr:MAG: hypothetical protein COV45_02160 [Deltaproteobacteria bacterium CG11_big_fil_rev_8_21_14_0_20_47_16]
MPIIGTGQFTPVTTAAQAMHDRGDKIPSECAKIETCIEKVCRDAGKESNIKGAPTGFWSQHSAAASGAGTTYSLATLNYAAATLFQSSFCRQPPTPRPEVLTSHRPTRVETTATGCSRMVAVNDSIWPHIATGILGLSAILALRVGTLIAPETAPITTTLIEGIFLWMGVEPESDGNQNPYQYNGA